ncbi:MAG: class I SAM-dependent methyltransferase [Acidobacteriota bacterium]
MIYKLSVLARNNRFLGKIIARASNVAGKKPVAKNADLIRQNVKGKSFADIGCMWGINGLNSFIAEDAGASEVVGVDVYSASEEFLEEKKRRNSAIRFVQGDINSAETTEAIGKMDVVLCGGVLYHTPDPVHLLSRLRAICKETLILNTRSIPEMRGLKNAAVFYPYLEAKQRKIWDLGMGAQKAITGPYEVESGYGNWFWGMTPSCVEALLKCAGFEVRERYVQPFECAFVCSAIDIQFLPEAGEWLTPKDAEFLKFQR